MIKQTLLALASLAIAITAQAAPPFPVSTSTATPVNVVDARNAVLQQITVTATGTGTPTSAGSGTGTASVPIPAGKIFVLEFVSFSFSLPSTPSGESLNVKSLSLSVNGPHLDGSTGPVEYQLPIPSNSAGVDASFSFASNQVLRLYAQPGTTIDVHLTVQSAGGPLSASASVSLCGYLVNK
jgi:hypothetical protein